MGRIITKNSSTAGTAPTGLVKGELAINVTDGKLYYGDGSTTKLLSTSGSGGGTGTVTSVQLANGTGISLSGTNPITTSGTITITNSDPGSAINLGSGTGISVTGTYPSFTINSTINTSGFLTTSSFNSWTGSSSSHFSGTSSYATTASYALNGNGLSGGSGSYIPLWSGSNTLTSSYLKQYYDLGITSNILRTDYPGTSPGHGLYLNFSTNEYTFGNYGGTAPTNNFLLVNTSGVTLNANGGANAISINQTDAIIIATTTQITGSLSTTGVVSFPGLTTSPQDNIILFDTASGQLYYTASSALNAGAIDTGSFVTTSSFNSYTSSVGSQFAGTASYASRSLSASYALTASYALNSTLPGGSNTQIQFNANSAFSGSPNFTFNSGSNILTLTGSLNITGSTTQTGNNTLTGNTILSGSIGISGSSTIQGTTTMTGSLSITGSTTQTGNNNLYGNTTLSGSIVISGSTTVPATPSIKVYGDMETNGIIKFLAVDKNIDTTISGSYIYVSGSTNDLYFSQNGAGFNNNVRLRWLEGGALYTGLLRGGVISSTPGTTTFNITSGSGLIVTMNASTASEPYPTVQYISWPNFIAQPIQYSGSAKITYLGISNAGTVIQQTVPWGTNDINQWDNSISLGVVLHLSGSVSTGVFNAPQISYGGYQKTDDFFRAFGPLKISGHTLRASGSSPTLSIIKDAGTSYREGANYIINANHPSTVVENSINVSKIYRYYLSGSTPVIDTGVNNAGYTEIDNKNYVDTTTGQLATVGASNWSIQRVFWIPNSPTNAFIVYYGNARYGTLLNATNAKDSEPFIEAPNTAQNAIFIGYIIIQGGGSGTPPRDLLNANEATIIPAGLFRNVGGVGSSGTNFVSTTLAGLADVSLSGNTPGDLLVYGTGATWNNKKQLTGSYGLTGSLTVTQNISASSFTGSLFGTASWATNFVSASNYVLNSDTSSFVLNSQTSSFVTNSQTSSFVTNSQTSSFVLNSQTSSFVTNSQTASFTTTSSFNSFTQSINTATSSFVTNSQTSSFVLNNQTSSFVTNSQTSSFVLNSQTSSFATTGSNTFTGTQTAKAGINGFSHTTTDYVGGSTGTNLYTTLGAATGNTYGAISVRTSGGVGSASDLILNPNGSQKVAIGNKTSANATLDVNGNTVITGSLNVTAGITGSFSGNGSGLTGVGGGYTVVSISSTPYNAVQTSGDIILLVDAATAGATTINLPTAVSNTAKFTIKKIDGGTNTVTTTASGSQTIDGGATASLLIPSASITLISNNSNWFII